jgi:hypothetical protein
LAWRNSENFDAMELNGWRTGGRRGHAGYHAPRPPEPWNCTSRLPGRAHGGPEMGRVGQARRSTPRLAPCGDGCPMAGPPCQAFDPHARVSG